MRCARESGAVCILVLTEAGGTARLVSKYRPGIPVICSTNSMTVSRQLNASFGIIPHYEPTSTPDIHQNTMKLMEFVVESNLGKRGDRVVITSGQVIGFIEGTTTMMRVLTL